ncbi:MAG: hypothetical protein DHS20C10_11440 [marine bacterium B5-7]|nr:MAG: hypothetical protein DHS20C10_11440 [marine bacterium B5-7]
MTNGESNRIYNSILETMGSSTPTLALINKALAKGFDLNHEKNRQSLLDAAVTYNEKDACQALVKTGMINQNTLNKALSIALYDYAEQPSKRYPICQILLKAGAKPEKDVIPDIIFPMLEDGLFEKGMRILVSLLKHGADVNATECEHGYHLLSMASQMYIPKDEVASPNPIGRLFELLLRYRINPEKEVSVYQGGTTPLMELVQSRKLKLTRLLLNYGADITMEDNRGATALAYTDGPKVKDLLVKRLQILYGKRIATLSLTYSDFHKNNEATLLDLINTFEEVKDLVDSGEDVFIRNKLGRTALHATITSSLGNDDAIPLLNYFLEKGVDPNAQTVRGLTALHQLCLLESLEDEVCEAMIKLLLRYDAKLDTQDIYGKTALHRAVQKDNSTAVTTLLRAGANPSITCKLGKTPSDYPYVTSNMKTLLRDATKNFKKKRKRTPDEEGEEPSAKKRPHEKVGMFKTTPPRTVKVDTKSKHVRKPQP